MADDTERLIVQLEARIRDFERNMQKASGTAERSYGRMRRDSRSATVQMEQDMIRSTTRINQALAAASLKIGAYGKAFVGGLVAGGAVAAVSGLSDSVRTATANVAKLSDQAKVAGVSLKALQELRFIGERNRIDLDAMIDGLKEMNLRADEFVITGKGSAADAFRRLGYDAADLAKKLKQPTELFAELIGRMGRFDRAAQIRLADEIFGGTGGERFVQLMSEGEEGIRRMQREAHEFGQVLDDQVIEKARELDEIFRSAANTFSTYLHGAAVRLADDLYTIVETFRNIENVRTTELEERLVEIGRERLELENEILRIREEMAITDTAKDLGFTEDAGAAAADIKRITDELKKRADEEQRILEILQKRKEEEVTVLDPLTIDPEDTSADFLRKFREELSLTADQRRLNAEAQRILNDAQREGAQITQEQAEALAREVLERDRVEAASKRGVQLLKDQTEAAREYLATIRTFEADLLFERQQMTRSPVEQRVYAEIRDLGLDINSIEGQRIADNIRINELMYEQRDIAEELTDALKDATSSLLQDLFAGRDILESMARIGSRFASKNFDALVDGIGNLFKRPPPRASTINDYMAMGGPGAGFGSPARPLEVNLATRTANSVQRAGNAFLDLIGRAEGTDRGRGYNESLGYGAFTGGPRNLIAMTLDQIDALQTSMLRHTENTFNSSALGRYQIVRSTLRGLRSELGLSGDQIFSPRLQDELAMQLARARGATASGLRNEWEGLRGVSEADILGAYRSAFREQSGAFEEAVKAGAIKGTSTGAEEGVPRGFAKFGQEVATAQGSQGAASGGTGFDMFAGLFGAAMGGFSTGYSSGNAGTGALGGAFQGLGAGMQLASLFTAMAVGLPIIGAVVGGIAGICSGPIRKKEKHHVRSERIFAAQPGPGDDRRHHLHAGCNDNRVRSEGLGDADDPGDRGLSRPAAGDLLAGGGASPDGKGLRRAVAA